jgi:two-component system sensor histidine kinase PilS (NtrC family)
MSRAATRKAELQGDFQPTYASPTDLAWRVIGLVNLYRLVVPPVLYVLQRVAGPTPFVGGENPELFDSVLALYFAFAIGLVLAQRRPWPSVRVLTLTHSTIDAVAIALLLYASGGVASGIAILLVVPVGAMALLAQGRDAFLIAALSVLAILIQQIIGHLPGSSSPANYSAAGVIGGVLFLVVLLVWPIANRLRESEALVLRQEVDLANLAQLSQYIVQHLPESILVIDTEDRIRLINESAAQFLGDRAAFPGALLGEASPKLLYILSTWRSRADRRGDLLDTFVAADGATVIRPHFTPLGGTAPAPLLVVLEDTSVLAERVQQSKLAALGRLSASIAHEIRNPVGAMSHAAQLLSESPRLEEGDLRLTEIIRSNAERVSGIITNVQQMSRRDSAKIEEVLLGPWLADFRARFTETMQCPSERLVIVDPGEPLPVRADPSQLSQVVWNLCDNAVKHGLAGDEEGAVELRLGRLAAGRVFLEVADRGPGIPEALGDRIFEPFFSGRQRGIGLGLFLARELAQTNGATLLYEARSGGGSVFRLVFTDRQRWEPPALGSVTRLSADPLQSRAPRG